MRRVPPNSTVDDLSQSIDVPNAFKSPGPSMVVEAWCIGVERMDRRALDRFTRDVWRKFNANDLEPLKWATLRRRRLLAREAWPKLRHAQPAVHRCQPCTSTATMTVRDECLLRLWRPLVGTDDRTGSD